MRRLIAVVLVGVALVVGSSTRAAAASISYNQSVGFLTTNWATTVSLPLFDPSLGTLSKVTWTVFGEVISRFQVESLDAAPSTITQHAQATLTLKDPGFTTLVVVIPAIDNIINVAAYDGVTDFGGTSGADTDNVHATKSESASSTVASVLANYIGLGTIGLPFDASGESSASGAGNLIALIRTQAAGKVTITYDYGGRPKIVPEPTMLLLSGIGLASMLAYRRRRR